MVGSFFGYTGLSTTTQALLFGICLVGGMVVARHVRGQRTVVVH